MSTFSWIILYFLQLYVVNVRSDSNNSFLSLLQLQINHCGVVSSCGMEYQNQRASNLNESCCTTCSCEDSCEKQGHCCPDFELKSMLGSNKSTSIGDYRARLLHLGVDIDQVGITQRSNSDVTVCVEAGSHDASLQSRMTSKEYYQMTATCSKDVSNTNVVLERKCTQTHSRSLANDAKVQAVAIPVTSLISHKTYKNIYCLQCNEKGISKKYVSKWRILYTCKNNSIDTLPELNVFDLDGLFQRIKSETNCFFAFKPKRQIADLTTKCNPVDVNTCPTNSDWQLKNICKRFHSPIDMFQEGHLTIYKNIACFLCNKEELSNPVCGRKHSPSEYSLELNMPDDGITNNGQGEHNLNVAFSVGKRNRCFVGYTFDPVSRACKRVLCPKLFYNAMGSCVPTFTYIENIYFTVLLEINFLGRISVGNYTAFFGAVEQNVRKSSSGLFEQFTYGLWEKEGSMIIAFSFIPSTTASTYVKILESLSVFLERMAFARHVPSFETMTYMAKDNNLVFVKGQLKERDRKQFKFPFRPYEKLETKKKEVMIKTCHLCYRTKIKRSSTYTNKNGDMYIKTTKVMLSPKDVADLKNDKLAVCLDDLYEDIENINTTYMFGGISAYVKANIRKPTQKDTSGPKLSNTKRNGQKSVFEQESGKPEGIPDNVSKGLLIVAAFALVGVVMCAFRMISRAKAEAPLSVIFHSRPEDGPSSSTGQTDIDKTTKRF